MIQLQPYDWRTPGALRALILCSERATWLLEIRGAYVLCCDDEDCGCRAWGHILNMPKVRDLMGLDVNWKEIASNLITEPLLLGGPGPLMTDYSRAVADLGKLYKCVFDLVLSFSFRFQPAVIPQYGDLEELFDDNINDDSEDSSDWGSDFGED